MANNIYVIDEEAPTGPTITIVDNDGTDWLTFSGVYSEETSITLAWSTANGAATGAAGTYYTDNIGASGRLIVTGVIENVKGSDGVDDIIGNELGNIIWGDQSRDGSGLGDTISAAAGNDTVYGGGGNDTIGGAEGNDRLYGGIGSDTINGDDGVDIVEGGAGADTLSGGADLGDTVSYASSSAAVTVKITYGSATTGRGGDAAGDSISGFTNVVGAAHNDVITDTVSGTIAFSYNKNKFDGAAGNDTIRLGGGDDTGVGGAGNDKLYGEIGNDRLEGGSGTDQLTGGAGRDILTGGTGSDTFYFRLASDSTVASSGRDTISDFSRGQGDTISLSGIDANEHRSGNQSFDFIGTRGFTGDEGDLRIRTYSDGYLVQGDTDGDRSADFSIFVDDVSSLRSTDFAL